jgi:ABC-type phosphate transport system substrate-binding protein
MKALVITVVPALALLALTGCGSASKVVAQKPQYCHTSQTITTHNKETVDSKTVLECTDDDIKRITTARLGMSTNCGEFTYWMQIGGRDVQRKGVSCQKMDGGWEIVNTGRK